MVRKYSTTAKFHNIPATVVYIAEVLTKRNLGLKTPKQSSQPWILKTEDLKRRKTCRIHKTP